MSRSSASVVDAAVVGGGPAGLNAALVLARTRRQVLLWDGGEPRNAASHAMHGFLSRDGTDPAELRRIGRDQLRAYPGVRVVTGQVEEVTVTGDGFEVMLPSGDMVTARKLLLAVGVSDELPRIAGLAPLYGSGVFHCPYCDGWAVRDQSVAVLSEGPGGFRLALLLLAWSRDVVLCTNGPSELGAEERAQLARERVRLCEGRVAGLEARDGQLERVVFDDGGSIERHALFFHGPVPLSSSLPERLGCTLTEAGRIEVDEAGRTSIPGVYAAGDAARRRGQHPATQVVIAAASGALAAIALHQELMLEDVGLTPVLPRLAASSAGG